MFKIQPSKQNINTPSNQQQLLYVVTQFYPPDYAPTGQLIQELVSYLASPNYLIKVFTGQPGYAYNQTVAPVIEHSDGVIIQRTRSSKILPRRIRGKLVNGISFFLKTGFFLLKNLQKEDKILFTTAPAFLAFLGYFIVSWKKSSYSCLIYDLYPDVAVELKVVSPRHWLVKCWDFLNYQTWRKAEQIIVLSQSMRQRILEKYPELVSKVSVIHNWANPDLIVPIPKSENWFAKEHDLVDKFTVLYSGNMGRCHDADTILEAVFELRQEPIQFIFIGGGAEYEKCLNTVEHWGLKNCLFLPYQEREIIPYSLTACDLSLVSLKPGMEGVVAPSKFYSMLASGRPIAAICEKYSYLSEMIAKSGCGMAVENGDGIRLSHFIRQMASMPDLAQELGQAGRFYLLSNFTPEIIAQEYIKALKLPVNIQPEKMIELDSLISHIPDQFSPKSIGQTLREMQLLTVDQVDEILRIQASSSPYYRFGEIAVMKGLIKKETIDYVLQYEHFIKPILLDTQCLLTVQLNDILEEKTNNNFQLKIGELAFKKGLIQQNTVDFLMGR